jgi:hypothetical protein
MTFRNEDLNNTHAEKEIRQRATHVETGSHQSGSNDWAGSNDFRLGFAEVDLQTSPRLPAFYTFFAPASDQHDFLILFKSIDGRIPPAWTTATVASVCDNDRDKRGSGFSTWSPMLAPMAPKKVFEQFFMMAGHDDHGSRSGFCPLAAAAWPLKNNEKLPYKSLILASQTRQLGFKWSLSRTLLLVLGKAFFSISPWEWRSKERQT